MPDGLAVPALRSWRRRQALTQHDLAARSGVSQVTIARAETGHAVRPTTVRRLAAALGVAPHELQGDQEPASPGHRAAVA